MLFNKTWTLTFGWMLAVDGCGVRCRTVDYRTATATWIVSHVQCICSGHQAPVAARCRPASPLPALPRLGPTTVSLAPACDTGHGPSWPPHLLSWLSPLCQAPGPCNIIHCLTTANQHINQPHLWHIFSRLLYRHYKAYSVFTPNSWYYFLHSLFDVVTHYTKFKWNTRQNISIKLETTCLLDLSQDYIFVIVHESMNFPGEAGEHLQRPGYIFIYDSLGVVCR